MKAFTLIEMLLAVAICAIVLVAINGVFATAVHLRDKTSDAVEESVPVNRALDILYRDLKGTVGPGGYLAGDFRCGVQATGATMGLSGEAGSAGLDFYTSTGAISDRAPWGDLQEVFYGEGALRPEPSGHGPGAVHQSQPAGDDTQTPGIQWLMGRCRLWSSIVMTARNGATPGDRALDTNLPWPSGSHPACRPVG
jgi:prepilin-type N-terminal cleavage/methylation domain-containing protein